MFGMKNAQITYLTYNPTIASYADVLRLNPGSTPHFALALEALSSAAQSFRVGWIR